MEKKVKRLCIIPKDLARIKGISPRQARNVYNDIKPFYNKAKHHEVSFKELSEYIDLPIEEIEKVIAS